MVRQGFGGFRRMKVKIEEGFKLFVEQFNEMVLGFRGG